MQEVRLPGLANFRLIDEFIVHVEVISSEEIGVEEIKLLIETGAKMSEGKPYCMLANTCKQTGSSTSESRQYAAEHIPPNKIADAIVTTVLARKLVANSYIRSNKPKIPTRLFTSERAALRWLKRCYAEYFSQHPDKKLLI